MQEIALQQVSVNVDIHISVLYPLWLCVCVSAETLLRLEATFAELRHVLQVLEEESDLIGGLETRAALPPTCYGNTEVLSQQIDHFQVSVLLLETLKKVV